MTKKLSVILLLNLFIAAGLGALIYQAIRRYSQGPGQSAVYRSAGPTEEKLIEEMLQAQNLFDAPKAYDALFGDADQAQLERLEVHSNHGIALRAAWEEVRRTVDETGPKVVGPKPKELLRFKQFVERRLQIVLPGWWADRLLRADARTRNDIRFSHLFGGSPTSTTIEQRDNEMVLKIGAATFTFPAAQVVREFEAWPLKFVSAGVGPENYYLAQLADHGSGGILLCIEPKSGEVQWKARVWGTGYLMGGGTGLWEPDQLTVLGQEDRVIVFGDSGSGYIEAFDAKDGTNLFRFNTMY